MIMEKPCILFLHGLESNANGTKANYLKKHFPNTTIPSLKPFWCLPYLFWKIIRTIYLIQPDIIIGSSFGGFLLLFLIQIGVWKKSSILLAPAMSLVFKHRCYIRDNPNYIIIVAGAQDTLVSVDDVKKLAIHNNVELIIEKDDHTLNKTMIEQDKLRLLVEKQYTRPRKVFVSDRNSCINYMYCFCLWLYCMFYLTISFLREPLNWLIALKMKQLYDIFFISWWCFFSFIVVNILYIRYF